MRITGRLGSGTVWRFEAVPVHAMAVGLLSSEKFPTAAELTNSAPSVRNDQNYRSVLIQSATSAATSTSRRFSP